MKSEKIWNKIVALKLFFFFSFEMDFWSLSLFVVFVALKMFLGRLSLWKYFLALFSLNFFRRWSLRNFFLLLLLWKLFLAPVAYLFENDFFVLVALNLILGASRSENFLVFLWKYLFGGHRFENSFLALVDFWKNFAIVVVKMFLVLEVLKMILCRF